MSSAYVTQNNCSEHEYYQQHTYDYSCRMHHLLVAGVHNITRYRENDQVYNTF